MTALVTGASGFVGKRLARRLAQSGRKLLLLGRETAASRLRALIDDIARENPKQGPPELILGDVTRPRLGLSDQGMIRLRDEVDEIFHLASLYDMTVPLAIAEKTNVDGTQHLLDVADELPSLHRLHHVSTIAVSGDFAGRYYEDHFEVGQRFLSACAETNFRAEAMVRMRREELPCDIYRVGLVVGDSRTGEMDKVDGPYFLFRLLPIWRKLPSWLPLFGIGSNESYVHAVPVDFVVNAMVAIADRKAPSGQTYCLTDPNPMTVPDFFRTVVDLAGGPRVRGSLPGSPLVKVLTLPGVGRAAASLARVLPVPADVFTYLTYQTTYDTSHVDTALNGTGIRCPPIKNYLSTLLGYYEEHLRK